MSATDGNDLDGIIFEEELLAARNRRKQVASRRQFLLGSAALLGAFAQMPLWNGVVTDLASAREAERELALYERIYRRTENAALDAIRHAPEKPDFSQEKLRALKEACFNKLADLAADGWFARSDGSTLIHDLHRPNGEVTLTEISYETGRWLVSMLAETAKRHPAVLPLARSYAAALLAEMEKSDALNLSTGMNFGTPALWSIIEDGGSSEDLRIRSYAAMLRAGNFLREQASISEKRFGVLTLPYIRQSAEELDAPWLYAEDSRYIPALLTASRAARTAAADPALARALVRAGIPAQDTHDDYLPLALRFCRSLNELVEGTNVHRRRLLSRDWRPEYDCRSAHQARLAQIFLMVGEASEDRELLAKGTVLATSLGFESTPSYLLEGLGSLSADKIELARTKDSFAGVLQLENARTLRDRHGLQPQTDGLLADLLAEVPRCVIKVRGERYEIIRKRKEMIGGGCIHLSEDYCPIGMYELGGHFLLNALP